MFYNTVVLAGLGTISRGSEGSRASPAKIPPFAQEMGHGTPYGSSSISGQNTAPPTADELVVAKHQGARTAQVAAALKAAR